jgi:transposase
MFKHDAMNLVILPLDLEIKLQENEITYAVNDLVEISPDEAFNSFLRGIGCLTYHLRR